MIPSNLWPHTHRELVQHYHLQYEHDIASNRFQPLVLPSIFLPALAVVVFLLIPHRNRPWLKQTRYAVFIFHSAQMVHNMRHVRAKNMAAAVGVGLISAWSIIWILAILVCYDAQVDFQRIERQEGFFRLVSPEEKKSTTSPANGTTKGDEDQTDALKTNETNGSPVAKEYLGPTKRCGEYAWQPFPLSPFVERVDWVLDILCNFRGTAWNWRTVAIPPPPKYIQEQLNRNSKQPPSQKFFEHPSQTAIYPTRQAVLLANAKALGKGYLILDLVKTIILHDPYFWGFIDRKPASYLPSFITEHPVCLHIYRITICQFAIKYALQTIFALGPLVFVGILGPSCIGARAEPWAFPNPYGSYRHVLDSGLAGWWSAWWHQTFRFAFEAPSRRIIQKTGISPKGPVAKLTQLVVAFGLSGILHACGSYTCLGSTKPMSGPLRFFLLQAFAIFGETTLLSALRGMGVPRYVPRWVKRGLTFFYVHLWFYHTAHLLCDDFAKGGVWLFEPIPVSLLRALGLGTEGDGWWCWGASGVRWHVGERWWKSGLAL